MVGFRIGTVIGGSGTGARRIGVGVGVGTVIGGAETGARSIIGVGVGGHVVNAVVVLEQCCGWAHSVQCGVRSLWFHCRKIIHRVCR